MAARYLQCGPRRIGLRGFRLDGAGRDKSGMLTATTAVGGLLASPLLFIKGGEFVVAAGTVGQGKLATRLSEAEAACVPPAARPATDPVRAPAPMVSQNKE